MSRLRPFCCISGKVSDYTTNNAYLRSQMNETEQARYDAAAGLFSGMTAEEYQELAKLAESQKAGEETGTGRKSRRFCRHLMGSGATATGLREDQGQKVFPESLDGSRGAQGGVDCDGWKRGGKGVKGSVL